MKKALVSPYPASVRTWTEEHTPSGRRARLDLERGQIEVYDDGTWYIFMNGRGVTSGNASTQPAARAKALFFYYELAAVEAPAESSTFATLPERDDDGNEDPSAP